MSVIEELGARVRATAEDLPVALLTKALDHLRNATDSLRWVRQESADPLGVPELSVATEHAQLASHALRVAQDQLTTYLAAIGLTADHGPTRAPAHAGQVPADGPATRQIRQRPAAAAPTVPRWWSARVAELTGGTATDGGHRDTDDAGELLRRVTQRIRSGDRDRLHRELRGVDADVGLGLAAVAAPMLRGLTSQLLGHPPQAQDLPRLRREARTVRDLLPGLPPAVLDVLLSRLCRTPPPRSPDPPHPADQAVATGVLTGVLLHRLGRDTPTGGEKHG